MEYGCIGEHLPHSFSKEIHGRIGGYDYGLREIEPDKLAEFMTAKDFKAINVTIPYKQAVIPFLDKISEKARETGAVNTIVNRDGRLYGYNTDFYGMTALIERNGLSLAGKKVIITGTGGTSKTARAVARSLGAGEIAVISRRKTPETYTYEEAVREHGDASVIINTTPCGMFPDIDAMPLEPADFPALEGVIDAVYNPLRSRLVSRARSLGIKAEGGLYMLTAQAVKAWELFFDKAAPSGLTDSIFAQVFSEKENIVLTGMPGSGKTTVGRLIAEHTGREFIDTDELIVERAGESITDIFAKYGEKHFRDLETEVIKDISSKSNAVIATGGGAVLRSENVAFLKLNGRIYFRDRALESLCFSADRPLALDRRALEKRYEERYEIYLATADETVRTGDDAQEAALYTERRHAR